MCCPVWITNEAQGLVVKTFKSDHHSAGQQDQQELTLQYMDLTYLLFETAVIHSAKATTHSRQSTATVIVRPNL